MKVCHPDTNKRSLTPKHHYVDIYWSSVCVKFHLKSLSSSADIRIVCVCVCVMFKITIHMVSILEKKYRTILYMFWF